MALIEVKCTNCNGTLNVDNTKEIWTCQYCNTQFLVEKAITHINITENSIIYNSNYSTSDFVITGGILYTYKGESTEIVIPNKVKRIKKDAFKKCYYCIESIEIPDNVSEIEEFTFYDFTRLKSITLPSNISSISHNFVGCSNLIGIDIPEKTKSITNSFITCNLFIGTLIPDNVTNITNSFIHCENLEIIKFSDNLFKIANSFNDVGVKNITIPDSVKYITHSFCDCKNIETVTLPEYVEITDSFTNCSDSIIFELKNFTNYINQIPLIHKRKVNGKCLSCGGELTFWTRKCKNCGRYN